ELDLSMILISHDLSVMAETCERVAIMYAGRLMEYGATVDVFTDAKHPYTQGLVRAFPDIRGARTIPESIPGAAPSLVNPPSGCEPLTASTSTFVAAKCFVSSARADAGKRRPGNPSSA